MNNLKSTREAYGDTLVSLGQNDQNLVVLDGEVSNSTFTNKFQSIFPDRFLEMYIAEQNMVSVALGLSKLGFSPFVSTFGAFFTRAFDQIRMSQYSNANIKFCGSHAGVHIGQDGSSQMALEDLAIFRSILNSVVLYPSDEMSTIQLVNQMDKHNGISYIRTTREKTAIIYNENEKFEIGGSKILHQSKQDKAVVFAAGITLHEALKAHKSLKNEGISVAVVDLYSIKPLDEKTIGQFAEKTKNVVVVEDHYPAGGLGEAVLSSLAESGIKNQELRFAHLCVKKIPHSGKPEELLRYEKIDSQAIVKTVQDLVRK